MLNNVAQVGERSRLIRTHKHEDDLVKFYNEQQNLFRLQESQRVLKNHNYKKDTEAINIYWYTSNQYENSLIKSASYSGLIVDRYI